MPNDIKFEAGKVTTLRVPVKLSYTKATDALNHDFYDVCEWKTTNHLTLPNKTPTEAKINGEKVSIYTIGTEQGVGTVKIAGTPRDLFNFAPAGFYAASWGNEQAIMRLNSVTFKISYLFGAIRVKLDYSQLSRMIDESTINFAGLLPFGDSSNAIFMDEEPYYKGINVETVNKLLARFDKYPNDPEDELIPTFEGLKQALNDPGKADDEGTPAYITAKILFDKIKYTMDNNPDIKEKLGALGDIFNYPSLMFSIMSVAYVEAELQTLPKNSTVEGLTVTSTDPRVIVWGIDVQ